MLRILLAGLRYRARRRLALVIALAFAAATFTVLVANSAASALALHGAGSGPASSGEVYDILVRPAGVGSGGGPAGLVPPNFTAGQAGGITLAQYHAIAALPGVAVAAPVALIGQVTQQLDITIDLTRYLTGASRQLFVAAVRQVTDRGLSAVSNPSADYSYVTASPVQVTGPAAGTADADAPVTTWEQHPGGTRTAVCAQPAAATSQGAAAAALAHQGQCWSTADGRGQAQLSPLPHGHVGITVPWTFQSVLAAVDPRAEAQLAGLNQAVTQGRYLPETLASGPPASGGAAGAAAIPVIAADQSYDDDTDQIAVRRLGGAAARQYAAGMTGASPASLASLLNSDGPVVLTRTVTAQQAYAQLVAAELAGKLRTIVSSYLSAGPVTYQPGPGGSLSVQPQKSAAAAALGAQPAGTDPAPVPADAADTAVRPVTLHVGSQPGAAHAAPVLDVLGTYSQARVAAAMSTAILPLEVYRVAPLLGADQASSAALGGQQLEPDANPGGYLTAPPALLTSLAYLPELTGPSFTGADGAAPVSTIRVRVAGVHGDNPVSRERIRAVASLITARTGLNVTVMLDATTATEHVALPAGQHGRPALTLSETWVRPTLTLSFVTRTDTPGLILFSLVLVVCALFAANATVADLRWRRGDLATLSQLGWAPGRLAGLLLAEAGLTGVVAGLAALAVCVPLGALVHLPLGAASAVFALPVAVAVALLGAAVPVALATRARSLAQGQRPARVRAIRSAARTVPSRTPGNLLRAPARNAIGVLAGLLATASVTMVAAVAIGFHGSLTGALLGRLLTLQPHGVDVLGAAGIAVLAYGVMLDLVVISVGERLGEIGVLWSLGWDESALRQTIVAETGQVAVAAAVPGAIAGLALVAAIAGGLPWQAWLVAALAAAGMTAVLTTAAVPGLARLGAAAVSRARPAQAEYRRDSRPVHRPAAD